MSFLLWSYTEKLEENKEQKPRKAGKRKACAADGYDGGYGADTEIKNGKMFAFVRRYLPIFYGVKR